MQNLEVVETKSYTSKYVLTELLKCDCGHAYKRKLWTLADGQEAVWRCSEKLKNGSKSSCKAPTLKEIPLHRAIMKAIDRVVENDGEYIEILRSNTLKVIQGYTSQKMEIKGIYERIEALEKEILELNQRSVTEGKLDEKYHRRIVELTKEIADLREKKKQAIEQEKLNKKKSVRKDKVEEVLTKVSKLESTKFDEELVWRVVQKITVKQNRILEILFFTGLMVEVEVAKK
ncbi:MAG: recombinase zinc beta ribbon domain-containing protein [Bacillota bacterium]